ncbi:PmbA protein [Azospirillum fermentarium]|uniref:TldD/PmbA family protein n=1 Tax=Azospirillum fermentarium TaxID=1233114 RepID=UPI0022276053|nr:TldD/PmbA family protein [Azospirillum fermentarium]MCW2245799.1 PmbA protein [Azospirillum fermentarium]
MTAAPPPAPVPAATDDDLTLLDGLVKAARRQGADAADAVLRRHDSLNLAVRSGETERLVRAESVALGLRVLIGTRQAVVSASDLSRGTLDGLVPRAVAMARAVPEDPFCGLADASAAVWPALDLDEPGEPSADVLREQALALEAAAYAVPSVANARVIDSTWSRSRFALAGSNGFAGAWSATRHALMAWVLAAGPGGMERGGDSDAATHAAALRGTAEIGRTAGERAVRRLGARKMPSGSLPVVFDRTVAGSLLDHLLAALSGPAVARGTSFLKNALGTAVFAPGVSVIDDPLQPRGLRSQPFDAEGVTGARRALIDGGVLTGWLLDARSARQLGLPPTGHAARAAGGMPGPSAGNVRLTGGAGTVADLISDIREGFYVTELMGFGVNIVTGDYSRGAAGYWIENGRITHPVAEMTVAGTLPAMFRRLVPAGDLDPRTGIDAPTVRIDGMTVAGR